MGAPSFPKKGKFIAQKNKAVKVNLPSLGYIMVARMKEEKIMEREISFGKIELSLQQIEFKNV